jgi:alkyldihydroxyacetonephosphate synthase
MRRWNGWGDDSITYHVPSSALPHLVEWVGEGRPPRDAPLEEVLRAVPPTRLPDHPLINTEAIDRVRHARGQSFPDWVALRTGRIGAFPAGIAYPESEEDLQTLFSYARQTDVTLIPYGGGTSVVGHINPEPDGPPSITVDLSRMSKLIDLDQTSRLATFGAGIRGPLLEAALRAQGYVLGHYPQSFEYSTLGGWVATRSSGQQSLRYGRIEQHFAGGRLVSPAGVLDMPPYPASAAGPDLRQLVLGSEGRLGIISQAMVRISRLPEFEEFHTVFFHTFEEGLQAVREIVQTRPPLSMLRLSTSEETEATLALAGHKELVDLAHQGLGALGYKRSHKCMLIIGITGDRATLRHAKSVALSLSRRHGGLHTGQYMGKQWIKNRFLSPYLRNTLWEAGYAIDTLETIVPWLDVPTTLKAITGAIHQAMEGTGERVFVFAHLSHLYETGASIYVQYLFRVMPDPDQTLEHWRRMKEAASRAIVEQRGTISHQHGVGVDHAPYLEAEKGSLGMALIRNAARCCDPDGIMNTGKLFR